MTLTRHLPFLLPEIPSAEALVGVPVDPAHARVDAFLPVLDLVDSTRRQLGDEALHLRVGLDEILLSLGLLVLLYVLLPLGDQPGVVRHPRLLFLLFGGKLLVPFLVRVARLGISGVLQLHQSNPSRNGSFVNELRVGWFGGGAIPVVKPRGRFGSSDRNVYLGVVVVVGWC